MNLQSVKTRFMGSYLFLLVLFVVQIPIIYWLVGGMSEKYAQVDVAGSLRKRAIEITELLNRHIMTGNEDLEKVFQSKKDEYGKTLEELRKGAKEVTAISDTRSLEKLDGVDKKWNEMRSALDKAMESGDKLRESKAIVEDSTMPMVEKINELISVSEGKAASMAAIERMRTIKLSYLLERYMVAYTDKETIANELKKDVSEFDDTMRQLKGSSTGIRAEKVNNIEKMWQGRKEHILEGVKATDRFHLQIEELVNHHTAGIVAAANELTESITASSKSAALRGILIMVASVLLSGAVALLFMWSTNTHILKPLMRVKDTVEDFAGGNFTSRADVKIKFLGKEIKDEIVSLGDSVDAMAGQMSNVIGRIADSSNHLASASEQLSTSSTQIAEGADRQSSQTAQVATAMEEMNATVIEVAKSSQQVSESARSAQEIATKGGDVVAQAISAMKEVAESTSVTADTIKKLGRSSEEIGTIVSVINDIADQTNLLALNAAIEAARAGEQGRGFAVVADEVRKLAERTTKATKEISGMIKSIQDETSKAVHAMSEGTDKVENGVRLANEAGSALKQIVTGVENVTDMIGHIATSAEEQSSTTDEISRNMDSIAEVAKSNVSAIGEVAKATNELAHLASELKDVVSNFTIDREGGSPELKVVSGGGTHKRQLHLVKDFKRSESRQLHAENS